MSRVYIAGSFSKPRTRKSLLKMIDIAAKRYGRVELYIPMEYNVPGDFQKFDGTWNLSNAEWAKRVYDNDIQQLDNAEVVIALNVGFYRTAGTVWEVGYAKGKGIPVYVYTSEWAKKNDMSLMLMNSYNGYIDEKGDLHKFTEEDLNKFNQK